MRARTLDFDSGKDKRNERIKKTRRGNQAHPNLGDDRRMPWIEIAFPQLRTNSKTRFNSALFVAGLILCRACSSGGGC